MFDSAWLEIVLMSACDQRTCITMGPLPDTQNCGLRMRRECRERFPRTPRVSDPDMHHGTCVTLVPWCMPWSLTNDVLWSRWRGKRSRHSRRMCNPQFYVSSKRPMEMWSMLHPVRMHYVKSICTQSRQVIILSYVGMSSILLQHLTNYKEI